MGLDQGVGSGAVNGHHHDVRGIGQLHDGGVGQGGGGEGRVHGAVLHGGGGVGEAQILHVKVVVGKAGGFQDLLGVDLGAGARVADANLLALQIRDGVDVGGLEGYQLDHLGIHARNGPQLGHSPVFRHGIHALIGIAQHVVLQDGQLRFPVVQGTGVGGGSAGGGGGDLQVVYVLGEHVGQYAAQGVIGARVAAGDHQQPLEAGKAALGAGLSFGFCSGGFRCRRGFGLLGAAYHAHNQKGRQQQRKQLFHHTIVSSFIKVAIPGHSPCPGPQGYRNPAFVYMYTKSKNLLLRILYFPFPFKGFWKFP